MAASNRSSASGFKKVFKWFENEEILDDKHLPIVYDDIYNISFMGLEKLHPFDSGKWGRIVDYLSKDEEFEKIRKKMVKPIEATNEILEETNIHTKEYLDSLKWGYNVAAVTEVALVALIPAPFGNWARQRYLLRKLRYQTGGTVMAAYLAYHKGWGMNIGGGFHHCSSNRGGGFCAYADVTFAIKTIFEKFKEVSRVMIVDLDAHQGNGHARDFMDDERVYIMDVYNRSIYPNDTFAKQAIKRKCEVEPYIETEEYLEIVDWNLSQAIEEFKPQFIFYNAGTDILDGDSLGIMSVSAEGVIRRDMIVFREAFKNNIPIVMATSGGYQRCTAEVIANSIKNLNKQGLLVNRGVSVEKTPDP